MWVPLLPALGHPPGEGVAPRASPKAELQAPSLICLLPAGSLATALSTRPSLLFRAFSRDLFPRAWPYHACSLAWCLGWPRSGGVPPLRPGEWAQLSCHQHRHRLSISSELLPGGWRGQRTTRRCSVSWEPSGEPPGWAQGCETFWGVGAAGRRCSLPQRALHQKPRAPGSQAGPALHSPTR